jgi:hypothetical protein
MSGVPFEHFVQDLSTVVIMLAVIFAAVGALVYHKIKID